MSLSSRASRKNKKQDTVNEAQDIAQQLEEESSAAINLFADEEDTQRSYRDQLLDLLSVKVVRSEPVADEPESEKSEPDEAPKKKTLRPKKPGKKTLKLKKAAPTAEPENEPEIEAEPEPEIEIEIETETETEPEPQEEAFEEILPIEEITEIEETEEIYDPQPQIAAPQLFHKLDYASRKAILLQSAKDEKKLRRKLVLRRIVTLIMACVVCSGAVFGVKLALKNGTELPFANFAALKPAPETELLEAPISKGYGEQTEPTVTDETTNMQAPADKTLWSLLLCNETHALPENYEATVTYVKPFEGISEQQCDSRIVTPLKNMFAAAEKDGIYLYFRSGYRSFATQTILFEAMQQDYMSQGMTAQEALAATKRLRNVPGTSEHETGLAVDIVPLSQPDMNLTAAFESTNEAKWLLEHCAEYGFILRYPKDKTALTGTSFEPWHFRYVGTEDAVKIMSQGICLEEYLSEA